MEYDLASSNGKDKIPFRGDILKNVIPISIERTHGKEVFVFRPYIFKNTKGIIFPNDDVIFLHERYDAIINNLSVKRGNGFLILSEIYHEFSVGDIFPVKISQISKRQQPMFKLFGFLGFVTSGNLEVGQQAYVRIKDMKEGKLNILETKLDSIIK